MDSSYTVVGIITIGLLVVFFVQYMQRDPIRIGAKGESRVARELRRLNPKEYIVLNDLVVKTSRGSSQIDHVVISIYGIFVIETKTYRGWIHGNENSEYWTQSIYHQRTQFRNPIRQNWSHIYALKNFLSTYSLQDEQANRFLLNPKAIPFFPIVVFAGTAELKNVYTNVPVVHTPELIRLIRTMSREPSLSVHQVKQLAAILMRSSIQSGTTRSRHIKQVEKHTRAVKTCIDTGICPRCGGILVRRNGSYGPFYGCSNYPRCTYTRKTL